MNKGKYTYKKRVRGVSLDKELRPRRKERRKLRIIKKWRKTIMKVWRLPEKK